MKTKLNTLCLRKLQTHLIPLYSGDSEHVRNCCLQLGRPGLLGAFGFRLG